VAQCPQCKKTYPAEVRRCPLDGTSLAANAPRLVPPAATPIAPIAIDRTTPAPSMPPAMVNDRTTPAPRAQIASSPAAQRAEAPDRHEAELEPGISVGEYQVTGKVGAGGMGTVYAGVHPVIGKKVAIKVLNGTLCDDAGMVSRFVQEARAVNQIGHRNIVDIFAFGQLPNGRHYFVMELLSGRSLKARLDGGPMPYSEAFGILVEVCDALAAAHAEGIVHRDLKPDNIHLAEAKSGEKTVKLLDFGIAKLLRADEGLASTRTGVPMGTPLYMSPEQCLGRNVDARTDLYSLGVIMFEIFTGQLPFAGPSYIETVNGHLQSPPPRPSSLAEVPAPLEQLILRCLEKDPARRPQSPSELKAELSRVAGLIGAELPRKMSGVHLPVGSRSTPLPNLSSPSTAAPPAARASGPGLVYGLIALCAGGLVVGGVLFMKPGKRAEPVERAAAAPMIALQVITDPPGADVLIDGKRQPLKTPQVFNVARAAHLTVRVEKADYAPQTQAVPLGADEVAKALDLKLAPLHAPSGHLQVRVPGARKASWFLDGKPTGDGSASLSATLPAGPHKLRVEVAGFLPREETIDLQPQQTETLEWVLQPASTHGSHKPHTGTTPSSPTKPDAPTKPPASEEPGAEWPPR